MAAGVAKALGLDRENTINAIAISGTAFNALRVVRMGALSHWKGLVYPNKVMFEAPDPAVSSWCVKSYGPEASLFLDRSHVVQLECLGSGIWGTASLRGRVLTFR